MSRPNGKRFPAKVMFKLSWLKAMKWFGVL
jgi:hypothetical protein